QSLLSARATTAAERVAAQENVVQVWKSLAGKQPNNPALHFEIAWNVVQLADLLGQDGQIAEASSSLDRALPSLEELAKAEPETLRWRQGLARAWETLGRVQAQSGHAAGARGAAGKAVTIAEDLARIDPAYLYDLACVLSLRGKLSSSEADAAAA